MTEAEVEYSPEDPQDAEEYAAADPLDKLEADAVDVLEQSIEVELPLEVEDEEELA